ncbi:MAG: methyltransferase domain-containing protein [Pseudomonadota bacterium]
MDNDDEIQFWNARGGQQWRRNQDQFETLFDAITARLLTLAAPTQGETVMDIGCGSGALSIAVARAVGPSGRVVGVDVSRPLLDAARENRQDAGLENLLLREADAQSDALNLAADLVVSRFGVMFFADPVVAFRNLLRNTAQAGRLGFAAWGEIDDNPWFHMPLRAALDQLGGVPDRDPRKPGPTAFGDPVFTADILVRAGWQQVEVHTETVELMIEGSPTDAARFACQIGPVSRVYKTHPPSDEDRAAIVAQVASAFELFHRADRTLIPACIHFVTAKQSPD